MASPFFSVIIPTLNEEKYLPTILKSLQKQTLKDFEVFIVDAHSRDRTCKVFEKFKKDLPSARFIKSEKNNVSFQRNKGAGEGKGEYFIFFDADVDIGPTFLEEIHVAILKKKFVLATTWMTADSPKPIDQFMVFIANLGWELAKGINKPLVGGFNVIVKREAFHKLGGFREEVKISEDQDFSIRALEKNIELTILQEPRVVFSFRRFRSEGTLAVLRKYARVQMHLLFSGPITKELFEYEMGGHVHEKRKKKVNLIKFKTYLKSIEKLQRKMTQLFVG